MHVYATYLIFPILAIFIAHCSFFFLLSSLMFLLSVESFHKHSPQMGYFLRSRIHYSHTIRFMIFHGVQRLQVIDLSLLMQSQFYCPLVSSIADEKSDVTNLRFLLGTLYNFHFSVRFKNITKWVQICVCVYRCFLGNLSQLI